MHFPPEISQQDAMTGALVIAENIKFRHSEILNGTATPLDGFDFHDNYSYVEFLATLARGKLIDGPVDHVKPSAAEQTAINPLLTPLHVTLDDLYEMSNVILRHQALQSWQSMRAEPLGTHDAEHYSMLHYALSNLAIQPQSAAAHDLFGTTAEEFRSIDQAHALRAVYEEFSDYGLMGNISAVAKRDRAALSDGAKRDLAHEFEIVVRNNLQVLDNDVGHIIQQSGLSVADIAAYMNDRHAGVAIPRAPAGTGRKPH